MNKLLGERDLIRMFALFPLLIAANSVSRALLICVSSVLIFACLLIVNRCTRNSHNSSSTAFINILVAAAVAALIDLTLQAFAWKLSMVLADYLPLIALSAVLVASHEGIQKPEWTKFAKIAATIIGLGAARELTGTGALFSQLEILFGARSAWRLGLNAVDQGFILSLLPVGGLIALGLLIATKNYFSKSLESSPPAVSVKTRRVRVTGPVS